jgi:hypothetical protein
LVGSSAGRSSKFADVGQGFAGLLSWSACRFAVRAGMGIVLEDAAFVRSWVVDGLGGLSYCVAWMRGREGVCSIDLGDWAGCGDFENVYDMESCSLHWSRMKHCSRVVHIHKLLRALHGELNPILCQFGLKCTAPCACFVIRTPRCIK